MGPENKRVSVRGQNKCVFWWRVTLALLFMLVVPLPVGASPKTVGVLVEGVVEDVGDVLVDGVVVELFPAVLGLAG